MPKSDRDYMKRRCEQLQNSIDRSLYHLGEMRKMYHPNYPKQVKAIEEMAVFLIFFKDVVKSFRHEMV